MFFESDELEKIEAYLSGELEGEALAAFEAELEENPQLKKKVKIHKAVMQGIRDYALLQEGQEETAVKSKREPSFKTIKKNPDTPKIGIWKPAAIAASVLLFLVSSVLFYTFSQVPDYGGSNTDYQKIADYQLITQKIESLEAERYNLTPTDTLIFSLFHNTIDALQYDFDGEVLQLFLDKANPMPNLEDFQVFVVQEGGKKNHYFQIQQNYYVLTVSGIEKIRSLTILADENVINTLRKL